MSYKGWQALGRTGGNQGSSPPPEHRKPSSCRLGSKLECIEELRVSQQWSAEISISSRAYDGCFQHTKHRLYSKFDALRSGFCGCELPLKFTKEGLEHIIMRYLSNSKQQEVV